jgi:hypothetical protein
MIRYPFLIKKNKKEHNMKNIIVMEGSGASLRGDINTISNSVTNCLQPYKDEQFSYCEIWSHSKDSVKELKENLESFISGDSVALFLKSLAAKRFMDFFKKHYTTFRIFKEVYVMFVDGHGKSKGSRVYCKRNPIEILDYMNSGNIRFSSVYQHRKAPTGAKLEGKKCYNYSVPDKDVTHTNIVNNKKTIEIINLVLESMFEELPF